MAELVTFSKGDFFKHWHNDVVYIFIRECENCRKAICLNTLNGAEETIWYGIDKKATAEEIKTAKENLLKNNYVWHSERNCKRSVKNTTPKFVVGDLVKSEYSSVAEVVKCDNHTYWLSDSINEYKVGLAEEDKYTKVGHGSLEDYNKRKLGDIAFFVGDGENRYKTYQMNDTELLNAYKDGRNFTYKDYLSDCIIKRYENELCRRDGETEADVFANLFADFVNGRTSDYDRIAERMSEEHRYLQSEMFKVCIAYMRKLADNANKGWYDGRNEWAVKNARELISHMDSAPISM